MPEGPVVVATCETSSEAESGREVLERLGIAAQLRPAGDRTEIVVVGAAAPAARRALLDDRLQREGRTPQEMSLFMKLMLALTFLAVIAFAVITIALG